MLDLVGPIGSGPAGVPVLDLDERESVTESLPGRPDGVETARTPGTETVWAAGPGAESSSAVVSTTRADSDPGARTGPAESARVEVIAAEDDSTIADFLAGIAHADTGFIARTSSGARAVAIVAATTAALCGDDIREALTRPDLEFSRSLRPPAVEAVRNVLLGIETTAPDDIARALAALTPKPR
ncbi:hypothetical protein GCM10023318_13050 [Nocardia callitridis]|uniref:Uncharacterized protein n=1 Tax=Nocardia callitridis TaxID=648753 RepID=A0ABP9K0D9_9NOCA